MKCDDDPQWFMGWSHQPVFSLALNVLIYIYIIYSYNYNCIHTYIYIYIHLQTHYHGSHVSHVTHDSRFGQSTRPKASVEKAVFGWPRKQKHLKSWHINWGSIFLRKTLERRCLKSEQPTFPGIPHCHGQTRWHLDILDILDPRSFPAQVAKFSRPLRWVMVPMIFRCSTRQVLPGRPAWGMTWLGPGWHVLTLGAIKNTQRLIG